MKHIPVMLKEVIENLKLKDNGLYIDLTLGAGGYTKEILSNIKNSEVITIDQDLNAVKEYINLIGAEKLEVDELNIWRKELDSNVVYILNTNFTNVGKVIDYLKGSEMIKNGVVGVVADLGFSSDQLSSVSGLSYKNFNADLDMRMDMSLSVKASDLLNALSKKELERIFFEYADEPRGGKIAEIVVKKRKDKRFETVGDFVHVLEAFKVDDKDDFRQRIFQSLRIAVNSELVNLKECLEESLKILDVGGIACFVSFHSGEDRIIKKFIKSNTDKLTEVNFKGEDILKPTELEVKNNPRSRSAKLRVFIKK